MVFTRVSILLHLLHSPSAPALLCHQIRGGGATNSHLSSSLLEWLAAGDAGTTRSQRLDVTLGSRSSTAVSVGSHRANYLRQRRARQGYLGSAGELHAGIVELLANEILNELLEGSCREMDSVVISLAAGSVRESVS